MNISKNPVTGELVVDAPDVEQVYLFNGTSVGRDEWVDDWEKVGEVPSLAAWQADPGKYTAAYLLASIVLADGHTFVAGGSFLYIVTWCKENDAYIGPFPHLYDDRNTVRLLAEEAGGVAW